MSEHHPYWKRLITAIVAVATIAWLLILVAGPFSWEDLLPSAKRFGLVAAIAGAAWACFVKWAWRWRVFSGWLVATPYLHGRWEGHDKPIFTGSERKMVLEIEQTFLSLRCCGYVQDKRGEGFCASLLSDADNKAFKLVYSYQSWVGAHSQGGDEHKGTVILDLIDGKPPRLEGLYFNARKGPKETSKGGGDIKVALVSRKLRRCFSQA